MRDVKFQVHSWRQEVKDFAWLKLWGLDGHLAAGKGAGGPWVRHVLSRVLAIHYGLERPDPADPKAASIFFAQTSGRPAIKGMPRLMCSHIIPGFGYDFGPLRLGTYPPAVVLVRDLRCMLIAHYEKWKNRYGLSWGQYLRLPWDQEKARCDLWWHIHFLNRWGDCAKRMPNEVIGIRYEDLRKNTVPNIECILRHYDLKIPSETIRRAVNGSMETANTAIIARGANGHTTEKEDIDLARYFTGEDGEYFRDVVGRNLRHAFGYDYTQLVTKSSTKPVQHLPARTALQVDQPYRNSSADSGSSLSQWRNKVSHG